MTIEELMRSANNADNTPIGVIAQLKSRRGTPLPDVEEATKALDPRKHDVMDKTKRKDKRVVVDVATDDVDDEDSAQKVISVDGEAVTTRIEPVNRIAVSLPRLIINRAVSFLFGNSPAYNCTPEGDAQEAILKALNRVLYDVKSKSQNRKIARSVFGFKEVAEHWYVVEKKHKKYGFQAKHKLRCAIYSPANGDTLYPYFDATGDMVAFSRAFSITNSTDTKIDYFETFTDTEHWLWVNGNNGYEVAEGYPKENPIGKIPVVYGYQPEFETEVVNALINRLETLLSNFADTNDYHASPKIFTTGQINSWAKKGEAGAVIEGEEGATMQYVSWANAPESVKLEIETLLKLIYTLTQTPDISFDSVKGMGAISGIALKLLFMDAHLKVQDKCEIFDEYLQRRVNIILAYLAQMNQMWADDCDEMEVEPEIIPYILTSEIDDLQYWMTANGNKPVISQKESVTAAGVSKDPEKTMELIKEEEASENAFSISEPIMDA